MKVSELFSTSYRSITVFVLSADNTNVSFFKLCGNCQYWFPAVKRGPANVTIIGFFLRC